MRLDVAEFGLAEKVGRPAGWTVQNHTRSGFTAEQPVILGICERIAHNLPLPRIAPPRRKIITCQRYAICRVNRRRQQEQNPKRHRCEIWLFSTVHNPYLSSNLCETS
jgi:hypothetical protein